MANGISPRKALAMGKGKGNMYTDKSNFGTKTFEAANGGSAHPDRGMKHMPMKDGDRGIGMPISHTKGNMPAQAAPMHGPHYTKG